MQITAQQVKELRERSGAGMMECKKALQESNGDIQAAMEWLRKQGLAQAGKKASRVAAEGVIALAQGDAGAVLLEVNCETDFVAKDESFLGFANAAAGTALERGINDVQALLETPAANGDSIEQERQALVARIGENIQVRRLVRVDAAGTLGAYVHGGRIGVLVQVEGGSPELARNLAMHVAAMNPAYVSADDVPEEIVAKEREIAQAQISEKDRNKPAEILERITSGRVAKIIDEMTLVGQPFVVDTSLNVGQVLKNEGARVLSMHRLAVGEGIEREDEDFASEVMKQAGLS